MYLCSKCSKRSDVPVRFCDMCGAPMIEVCQTIEYTDEPIIHISEEPVIVPQETQEAIAQPTVSEIPKAVPQTTPPAPPQAVPPAPPKATPQAVPPVAPKVVPQPISQKAPQVATTNAPASKGKQLAGTILSGVGLGFGVLGLLLIGCTADAGSAAMIPGICTGIFGTPLAAVGLSLSTKAVKANRGGKKTGVVLGLIGLILNALMVLSGIMSLATGSM